MAQVGGRVLGLRLGKNSALRQCIQISDTVWWFRTGEIRNYTKLKSESCKTIMQLGVTPNLISEFNPALECLSKNTSKGRTGKECLLGFPISCTKGS